MGEADAEVVFLRELASGYPFRTGVARDPWCGFSVRCFAALPLGQDAPVILPPMSRSRE